MQCIKLFIFSVQRPNYNIIFNAVQLLFFLQPLNSGVKKRNTVKIQLKHQNSTNKKQLGISYKIIFIDYTQQNTNIIFYYLSIMHFITCQYNIINLHLNVFQQYKNYFIYDSLSILFVYLFYTTFLQVSISTLD